MANEKPRDPRHSETPPRAEGQSRGTTDSPHRGEGVIEREGRPWWTDPASLRRVSWGAVFAGAVVAIVVQLALGLLGLSIGLGVVDPATASPGEWEGLGIGAGIWVAISTIIALFVGGYVAAHLAGAPILEDGVLHGVLTWGLATLFTFFMMTTAVGQVLSGAAGVVGQGVTTFTEQADPQEAPPREMAVDMLATYTDMSRAEAEEAIEEFEQDAEAQAEEAPEIADRAADVTSQAALWAFIAMMLGVAAAAGGGYTGTPRDLPAASHSLRND